MLLGFFLHLREFRLPVSLREQLDFLSALKAGLVYADLGQFYFLSRLCLVKDEKYYDRFDLAFDAYFKGLDHWQAVFSPTANAELLASALSSIHPDLSESALAQILNEYVQAVAQLQTTVNQERNSHDDKDTKDQSDENDGEITGDEGEPAEFREDGERGEGDAGEGESGERGEGEEGEDGERGEGEDGERGQGSGNKPGAGIRTDFESVSQRSATKVWQLRQFADYDPEVELGTRNLKMALRRLRKFARTAADLEFDLEGTIRCTARNGGILDIREIPERHNAIKVLLFLDVGGSMKDHVERCAQLFAAARSEFKYLEYFYFHNFIYESVWTDNDRRGEVRIPTQDILKKYGRDYKVIFVSDAQMGRHEIADRGGSVEHFNAESGEAWMSRVQDQFRKVIWLNPVAPNQWQDSYSTVKIRRIMEDQMFHLSVDGLESAMKYLVR